MEKVKVLIVDDSAVIRKVLGDFLALDPGVEVVGTASNGKIALDKIALLQPDIITLDIEMPEMDGLETLKRLRQGNPKLPVIMCSSLTAAGAAQTLDALALGASDYVTKPSSHGANTREVVGEELLRKIKGLAQPFLGIAAKSPANASFAKSIPTATQSWAAAREQASVGRTCAEVVAIGVSTGGPNALADVLPKIPADLKVPILIVQHMPPLFTRLLAERLDAQSQLTVVEGQNGQEVLPGCVYLAPGGLHMEVKRVLGRTYIALHEGPPENSCRPAVDVLFRSVGKVYGRSALAVVLTGMGQDGLKGSQSIRDAGGRIIAQDRESSTVWGMPGALVDAGVASLVVPLSAVPGEILAAVAAPSSAAAEQRNGHRVQ